MRLKRSHVPLQHHLLVGPTRNLPLAIAVQGLGHQERINLLRKACETSIAVSNDRDAEVMNLLSLLQNAISDLVWSVDPLQEDPADIWLDEKDAEACLAAERKAVFDGFEHLFQHLVQVRDGAMRPAPLDETRWQLLTRMLHVWGQSGAHEPSSFRRVARLAAHDEDVRIFIDALQLKVEHSVVSENHLFEALQDAVTGGDIAPAIVRALHEAWVKVASGEELAWAVQLLVIVRGDVEAFRFGKGALGEAVSNFVFLRGRGVEPH